MIYITAALDGLITKYKQTMRPFPLVLWMHRLIGYDLIDPRSVGEFEKESEVVLNFARGQRTQVADADIRKWHDVFRFLWVM